MEKRILQNKYGNTVLICDNCGNEFKTFACYLKRNRKHRFCSKKCEGEFKCLHNTRENWRGGCIGKSTGYKYIEVDGKQIGEHILVAEKHHGRRLRPGEVVHHINGDKLDNRPENLQIMTNSQHIHLHHPTQRTKQKCRRCGNERYMHGRGLCHNCYQYAFRRKILLEYPLGDEDVEQYKES